MRWFKWFGKVEKEEIVWEMSGNSMYQYRLDQARRENNELMSRLYKSDKGICQHGLFRKECKLCEKKLGFM